MILVSEMPWDGSFNSQWHAANPLTSWGRTVFLINFFWDTTLFCFFWVSTMRYDLSWNHNLVVTALNRRVESRIIQLKRCEEVSQTTRLAKWIWPFARWKGIRDRKTLFLSRSVLNQPLFSAQITFFELDMVYIFNTLRFVF